MRGAPGARMRIRVELIHGNRCPHAEAARRHLRTALRQCGLPQVWISWDLAGPLPDHVRGFPSPTVLVEGRDVMDQSHRGEGIACAVEGAPPSERIVAALRRALA